LFSYYTMSSLQKNLHFCVYIEDRTKERERISFHMDD
jgi:hypothetical protein